MSIIGILPAAGGATRLHGLPKFLLPTADSYLLDRHIRRLRDTGARVWIGASKATLPFVKPYAEGCAIATVTSETMTETVLAARKAAGDDVTLFSMPDTHWTDPNVFPGMLNRIEDMSADIAIAVWRIRPDQVGKLGMVDMQNNHAREIVDKNPQSGLEWAWGAMAWTPRFWDFIKPEQPHMGYALQAAIDVGVKVWCVPMEGFYWDMGTYSEYALYCSSVAEMMYAR